MVQQSYLPAVSRERPCPEWPEPAFRLSWEVFIMEEFLMKLFYDISIILIEVFIFEMLH